MQIKKVSRQSTQISYNMFFKDFFSLFYRRRFRCQRTIYRRQEIEEIEIACLCSRLLSIIPITSIMLSSIASLIYFPFLSLNWSSHRLCNLLLYFLMRDCTVPYSAHSSEFVFFSVILLCPHRQ